MAIFSRFNVEKNCHQIKVSSKWSILAISMKNSKLTRSGHVTLQRYTSVLINKDFSVSVCLFVYGLGALDSQVKVA